MKRGMLVLILITLLAGRALAAPENAAEYATWERKGLEAVEALRDRPAEEAIPKLGGWLRKLSRPSQMEKGERPIYREAQKLLLSFPNHAEFFAEEINKGTACDVSGVGEPSILDRDLCFQSLEQLPSPRTVAALGELLFDERNPFKDQPSDSPWVANCHYAVGALHRLGLRNPPVVGKYPDSRNDLHTWQLWFEQVRAGTRTFSFEGDDQIYSLSGPVEELRNPVASAAAERESPSLPKETDSPRQGKWAFFGTILIFAIAGLVIVRRRKTPAS